MDFELDHLARRLIDQVALGERDDAMAQPKQAQDLEMFTRLRHHRIICGHDEHSQVDTRGAGEHVLDETLVARHVDDAEPVVAEVEDGKANVDGDAACFFLG